MKTNRISNRTLAAIAAPALIAGTMLIPGTASASEGGTQCANYGLGGTQLAIGATTTGPTIGITTIPAGSTVTLMGTAQDSYTDRALGYAQPNEQFILQFLDANGSVIATSGPSGDLPDDTDTGTWTGGLGVITPASDVTAIRAVHAGGAPTTANSLTPISTGICWTPPAIIEEPVEEAPVEETPAEKPETQVEGQGAEGEPAAETPVEQIVIPEAELEPAPAAPVEEEATPQVTAPVDTTPVVADPAPKAAAPEAEVAGATQTRGALPETGSETIVFAGIGSLLLAAGRGLIRVSNRNA